MLKNIAIAGATGHIGKPLMKALIEANQFNLTVLTRADSPNKTNYPASVKTPIVDYSKPETLVEALKGQDAVISGLSGALAEQQEVLLKAAVQAGGMRFIPSQFGSDTLNPQAAQLPVFASKKKIEAEVEAYAAQGKLSYTYMMNGPFLDFGLMAGFLGLDLKKKQATLLDGGVTRFSTSTLADAAKAVVGVLNRPEDTKNRPVYVQSTATSLKHLLQLAKNALGADGWTEVDAGSTEALQKACVDKLANGQKDMGVMVGFLQVAIFRNGYGGQFQKLNNDLLGIKELKDAEVEEVIRGVAKMIGA